MKKIEPIVEAFGEIFKLSEEIRKEAKEFSYEWLKDDVYNAKDTFGNKIRAISMHFEAEGLEKACKIIDKIINNTKETK